MSNVQRFDKDMDGEMEPVADGEWVRYSDYRAILAAPVAPATVVPEADPFGVDADLCGELHELDTDLGYRAASRIGQLAMLAASQREGGGT